MLLIGLLLQYPGRCPYAAVVSFAFLPEVTYGSATFGHVYAEPCLLVLQAKTA